MGQNAVSYTSVRNENHIRQTTEAADDRLWPQNGRLDARLLSYWQRGYEILELNDFLKPAIASQSRVFCFLVKQPTKHITNI
jgi:hypothetical protein